MSKEIDDVFKEEFDTNFDLFYKYIKSLNEICPLENMHQPNLVLVRYMFLCKNNKNPYLFFCDNKIEDFEKFYDMTDKSCKEELLEKIKEIFL